MTARMMAAALGVLVASGGAAAPVAAPTDIKACPADAAAALRLLRGYTKTNSVAPTPFSMGQDTYAGAGTVFSGPVSRITADFDRGSLSGLSFYFAKRAGGYRDAFAASVPKMICEDDGGLCGWSDFMAGKGRIVGAYLTHNDRWPDARLGCNYGT